MSTSKGILLLGLVCTLCCIPELFRQDDNELKEGSVYLKTVQSNNFENMVLISLALAVPSVLDVLADLFEKKNLHVCDDEQCSRIFLAFSLLSQPLLFLYFGIQCENLIATYAIKNIRAISCATVAVEQLHVRCGQVFYFKISFFMLFLWNVGSVIMTYSIYKNPESDVISAVAMVMKGVAGIILMVCLFKHYNAMTKGIWHRNEHRYQKWHTVAFEFLIIVTLLTNSSFDVIFQFDNIYELCEVYVLATAYTATCFQFLYSNLLTQQFRFDLVVAKEKLSIKRQFVRYVSHEVRTPLNSCSLGLSYLRNMCTAQSVPGSHSSDSYPSEPTANNDSSDTMLTVIDEITDCCDTAIDFMNNMLFYEKIDTLDLPLYFKTENILDICKKAYTAFLLSSRHLNVQFTFDVHESISKVGGIVPYIRGDYAKINVVFRNIISNALKFSPPKSHVKFRLVPIDLASWNNTSGIPLHEADATPSLSEETTTHYRVSIEDEGIGMTQKEQNNLFTGVIQFNPNESQSGGGSGMGLFLSHKIMTDHGATIHVHSEGIRGRGTKFFIDFPKSEPDAIKEEEQSDVKKPERSLSSLKTLEAIESFDATSSITSPAVFTKPLHLLDIMICDDSLITRKMLQRSLKQHRIGGTFTQTADGAELLSMICLPEQVGDVEGGGITATVAPPTSKRGILKGNKNYQIHPSVIMKEYDIIVMDKSMPQLNGDVATAKLRELGYDGIILGLTGNALAEDLQDFCKMGANFAFSKPLDMEKFIKTIKDYYLVK
jgi:signal transduction histidine kinase/CheY-like chemotaxis protein